MVSESTEVVPSACCDSDGAEWWNVNSDLGSWTEYTSTDTDVELVTACTVEFCSIWVKVLFSISVAEVSELLVTLRSGG